MKDDLGFFGGDNLVDLRAVAHIAQQRNRAQPREPLAQLHIDAVKGEFAIVEQDEPAGRERGDLPSQLRADRSPRAGDENAAAADEPRHALAVEHRLGAAEQILQRDRFEGALGIVEIALKIGELRQPARGGSPAHPPGRAVAGSDRRAGFAP